MFDLCEDRLLGGDVNFSDLEFRDDILPDLPLAFEPTVPTTSQLESEFGCPLEQDCLFNEFPQHDPDDVISDIVYINDKPFQVQERSTSYFVAPKRPLAAIHVDDTMDVIRSVMNRLVSMPIDSYIILSRVYYDIVSTACPISIPPAAFTGTPFEGKTLYLSFRLMDPLSDDFSHVQFTRKDVYEWELCALRV